MSTLRETFLEELADVYDAEKQLVKALPKMAKTANNQQLREGFEEHLELHRLDCLASHGNLSTYEMVKQMMEETPAVEIRPEPLLRGDDLIAQGYTPGPLFKEMLQAIEDAQLEGGIHTHAEALRLVRERFPLPTL